jgi:hypothetical protein
MGVVLIHRPECRHIFRKFTGWPDRDDLQPGIVQIEIGDGLDIGRRDGFDTWS